MNLGNYFWLIQIKGRQNKKLELKLMKTTYFD